MKSEEKNYFNKIAGAFDKDYNVYLKSSGMVRVRRRVELFIKHCNLTPDLKILEIGCGTGEYSRVLLQRGLNLFATDLSFNMIKEAQKKVGPHGNPKLFVSDIEMLPVPENKFDAVIGNSVLHHLRAEKALEEVFRVLKKGGGFAFSEPNMFNPQIFIQKNIKPIKKLLGDTPDETAFSSRGIKRMLEKAGFKKILVMPFDFLHPYTPAPFVKCVDRIGLILEKTPLREIAGSLFITGEK